MKKARNWNDETYHAINVYEKVLGIIGVWPLNVGDLKSIARCSLAILIQVNIRNSSYNHRKMILNQLRQIFVSFPFFNTNI